MRTDELISQLVSRATPVRPLPAPWVRELGWLGVATAAVVAAVSALGPRADVAFIVWRPLFAWTMASIVCLVGCAAGAALVLAVPGAKHARTLRAISLALGGLWAITLVVSLVSEQRGFSAVSDWPVCFAIVTAVSVLPAVWLLALVRRASPLSLAWTAGLSMAAALAAGAVAIQLICPQNDPAHLLLGHMAPVVALSSLAAPAGARLFSRTAPWR